MISKGILYFDMWLVITPDLFSDSSLLAGTEKQTQMVLIFEHALISSGKHWEGKVLQLESRVV